MMCLTDQSKEEEKEVWLRFQQGDEGAFSTLYQTYIQVIYAYCRKFSQDEELIEDCIHNLFLDLWKNRSNLSVPASIRFYLYASVKRRIHKEVNRKRFELVEDAESLEVKLKEMSFSAEDEMIAAQHCTHQKQSLDRGLLQLTENQREAIYLKYYKELSFQEISAAMNMSTDNIYKLVSRGLSALKKHMKPISLATLIFYYIFL